MRKRSILLVDDEKILLITLGDVLKEEGFDVTTVDSGKKAITKLNQKRYDIVITDLVMEGLDGIDILKKSKRKYSDTPVIILTGRSDRLSADKAKQLGADDYLLKPCEIDELLNRISQLLEKV